MEKTHSYFEFDYDVYRQIVSNVIDDDETIFYLDTSFLNKLLFIREKARKKILEWLNQRKERVFVPYWVYMEYMKRAVSDGKIRGISPWADFKFKKRLEDFKKNLYLYLDDCDLNNLFPSMENCRSKYSEAVDTIGKIEKITGNFSQAHNEISSQFFPHSVLKQIENEELLESKFKIRCDSEVPPGFAEYKNTNQYGDFFIWNEILQKQTELGAKKAVFLTNDQKNDLVYSPQKIKFRGRVISNEKKIKDRIVDLPIKLELPQLCLEFQQSVGADQFYIVNLKSFMGYLYEGHEDDYIDFLPMLSCDGKFEEEDQSANSSVSGVKERENSVPLGSTYSVKALHDAEYIVSAGNQVDDCISLLKSRNWYSQSDGIKKYLELIPRINEFDKNSLFVLGRNIYQAACGDERDSLGYLRNLHENIVKQYTDNRDLHVLDGMFYEVYFDKYGQFRSTLKGICFDYLEDALETNSNTWKFIRDVLTPYRENLLYLPGDTEVVFNVKGTENEGVLKITSISYKTEELLTKFDESEFIPIASFIRPQSRIRYRRSLNECLARAFVIPKAKVNICGMDEMQKWMIDSNLCLAWNKKYRLNNI